MPRPPSVRTRREFQALSRSTRRGRAGCVWVVVADHPDGGSSAAVAFAIGRRVGNAVVRNRLRRRLRELMATRLDDRQGLFLVGVTPEAADLGFSELGRQLDLALERVR